MMHHIKRLLKPYEQVHHINGEKLDNRIENLKIVTSHSHRKEHSNVSNYIAKTGEKICSHCKKSLHISMFSPMAKKPFYSGRCKPCKNKLQRIKRAKKLS